MKEEIYLLKLWTSIDDDDNVESGEWRDLYFNVNTIFKGGFFIPKYLVKGERAINIIAYGEIYTIKQEAHILEWLKKHFTEGCIINPRKTKK
jgi:hypothetical protein